jgi:hypothetical protein
VTTLGFGTGVVNSLGELKQQTAADSLATIGGVLSPFSLAFRKVASTAGCLGARVDLLLLPASRRQVLLHNVELVIDQVAHLRRASPPALVLKV